MHLTFKHLLQDFLNCFWSRLRCDLGLLGLLIRISLHGYGKKKHILPMAAYFATVAGFILSNYVSWHLWSSEKLLVRKKWSIDFKDFTQIFLFSFSLTNVCLPCQLRKAYAVLWAANRFVGSGTPKHNSFD